MGFSRQETSLIKEVVGATAARLEASYSAQDNARFVPPMPDAGELRLRVGAGSAAWPAVAHALALVQELTAPGITGVTDGSSGPDWSLDRELKRGVEAWYEVLLSFFAVELDEREARTRAFHGALGLIESIPDFRSHALWNIFASLKDPAVWDSYSLSQLKSHDALGRLDLMEGINAAIRARDPELYLAQLREHGLDGAYDYQRRLVKRAYPGWKALLIHDIAHRLASGGAAADGRAQATPAPFLPRVVAQHAATQYQTDLHPESRIGDANFLDHPHRGITTGQTGAIGVGCVIYPCTLGGITDHVRARHPVIGDYVLIGTDAGIFGVVEVGDGSVIGSNSEIYGFVRVGKNVRIGLAVVVQTVRAEGGKPGRLIIEDGSTIGDRTLIVNDQPSDLVIPPDSHIPPHAHVVNDGFGRPKLG